MKYLLQYLLILLFSILLLNNNMTAQPIITPQADDPSSYRNTHISFEYLDTRIGPFENGGGNGTALAAGLRIDTEIRKYKLAPRLYIENSYLSGLKNHYNANAGTNKTYSTNYIIGGYTNIEFGAGYNLLTFKYKSGKRFVLNTMYDGVANVSEKTDEKYPVTIRNVIQPRIGYNIQNYQQFLKISMIQLGGAWTRNHYTEVNSSKHGTCVHSNYFTWYYDYLIGVGNLGPINSSSLKANTPIAYNHPKDQIKTTGWRVGCANRGDVYGSGTIYRLEFGKLPGFSVESKGNWYALMSIGFGWSVKVKAIDKLK